MANGVPRWTEAQLEAWRKLQAANRAKAEAKVQNERLAAPFIRHNASRVRSEPQERAGTGRGRARNDPNAPNQTEARFNREVLHGAGIYEGVTFRLPAAPFVHRPTYTPDFALFLPDGRLEVYEVKGSYALPSEARAETAFNVASGIFTKVGWNWAKLTNGGVWKWKHGRPPSDEDLAACVGTDDPKRVESVRLTGADDLDGNVRKRV